MIRFNFSDQSIDNKYTRKFGTELIKVLNSTLGPEVNVGMLNRTDGYYNYICSRLGDFYNISVEAISIKGRVDEYIYSTLLFPKLYVRHKRGVPLVVMSATGISWNKYETFNEYDTTYYHTYSGSCVGPIDDTYHYDVYANFNVGDSNTDFIYTDIVNENNYNLSITIETVGTHNNNYTILTDILSSISYTQGSWSAKLPSGKVYDVYLSSSPYTVYSNNIYGNVLTNLILVHSYSGTTASRYSVARESLATQINGTIDPNSYRSISYSRSASKTATATSAYTWYTYSSNTIIKCYNKYNNVEYITNIYNTVDNKLVKIYWLWYNSVDRIFTYALHNNTINNDVQAYINTSINNNLVICGYLIVYLNENNVTHTLSYSSSISASSIGYDYKYIP